MYECQEIQIKNPLNSTLGLGLVEGFESEKLFHKKDIFTKDFQTIHTIIFFDDK